MPARPARRVGPLPGSSILLAVSGLALSLIVGCKQTDPIRTPVASAQPAPPVPVSTNGQPQGDGITAEAARSGGPPAPANLAATSQPGAIHLSWMPGSSAAKEFHIYRIAGTDLSAIKLVGAARSIPTPPITFDDATGSLGVTYTYFVTAVDEFGHQSGYSNMITITVK
jgi:hypothetical protein